MKKKMVYVVAALIIGAVTVFNVKTVLDANRTYDLAMTSIDALSEDGEGDGGNGGGGGESDTGAHIKDEDECHNKNGYWNMALVSDSGGVITQKCTISGEISILGITIKGSYQKGENYHFSWANWKCVASNGNCCLSDKQGIRITQK